MAEKEEMHLDVYSNRSELHYDGETTIFQEGTQNSKTQERYNHIKSVLDDGFLDLMYRVNSQFDFSNIDDDTIKLLKNLVDGITSEVGRALVGLTFLQLTVKAISPEQSIRLHKGGIRSNSFSWVNGISLRTLDRGYSTPFLREKGLLNVNRDGVMMTRSLAENYPYSQLYKAEMRGPFKEWILIVDALESGKMNPAIGLQYLLSLLRNRSDKFNALTQEAQKVLSDYKFQSFKQVTDLLMSFFDNTRYSARAFEVVIHSFMQALQIVCDDDLELGPLTQMRSANKKHGNVGDIELKDGRVIVEAWDAKYGKPYLYEELGELKDKIEDNPGVQIAGFIVDKDLNLKPEIEERVDDYSNLLGVNIYLFDFKDWIDFKTEGLNISQKFILAKEWLKATVETFSRKRAAIAPIDEPCDGWLEDLIALMKE